MTTTYVNFVPSALQPFQFQATLDGAQYTVTVTWSLFGQRYYINVYDLSNNLALCTARVGSPQGTDINLVAGVFSSTLVFREASGQFEVSP